MAPDPPPEGCVPGSGGICDDNNECTFDACIDGFCQHTPLALTICDDHDDCTDPDYCLDGVCVGDPLDCDDDNPCTFDYCGWVPFDPPFMDCRHRPISGPLCDDGDLCTINDECEVGACIGEWFCDDGTICTDDFCVDGVCSHQPTTDCCELCNDDNVCTDDFCDQLQCTGYQYNTAACDDEDPCTEDDTCSFGICKGTPVNCDDEDLCTTDLPCDPVDGCVYVLTDCDDEDPCTTDWCDPATGLCDNDETWPPVDTCAPLACSATISMPAMIFLNNDDDNDNGDADYLEDGPVTDENDLVLASLTESGCAPFPECIYAAGEYFGTPSPPATYASAGWLVSPAAGQFPPYFKAYLSQDMSGPIIDINDPLNWVPWDPAPNIYVGGGSTTSACGVPGNLVLRCPSGQHSCLVRSAPTVVVSVASLEWQVAAAGNPPLDTCPNNGGVRIFPGKTGPDDQLPQIRKKVKLVATIDPPISGITVYFRVWDVDDPFDQNNAAMPDVGLIDDDLAGPDNRIIGEPDDPAIVTYPSVNTDEEGKAIVTVTVSMQPGNNYRAGASVLQDAIGQDQATQAIADALNTNGGAWSDYSVPLVWSPMLTVWRKLHVETDVMTRPTFAENTIDTFWNEPSFPLGTLVIDIGDQDDYDQFDNGYIRIKADGFPDIVALIITFSHSVFDDVIEVDISEAAWGDRPIAGDCTISDDDLYVEANFLNGVVGSDIGTGNPPDGILPFPDTTGLEAHYELAYILPILADEYTSTQGIPFIKNIQNITQEVAWTPLLDLRGLPVSVPEFWTAYVYSAFQAERNEDYDGETFATKGISTHKESVWGNTPPYSTFGAAYTGMSVVFVESLDDGFGPNVHRITVAHEIAHTLGVDHGTLLMSETEQTNEFSAESLVELRVYNGP